MTKKFHGKSFNRHGKGNGDGGKYLPLTEVERQGMLIHTLYNRMEVLESMFTALLSVLGTDVHKLTSERHDEKAMKAKAENLRMAEESYQRDVIEQKEREAQSKATLEAELLDTKPEEVVV